MGQVGDTHTNVVQLSRNSLTTGSRIYWGKINLIKFSNMFKTIVTHENSCDTHTSVVRKFRVQVCKTVSRILHATEIALSVESFCLTVFAYCTLILMCVIMLYVEVDRKDSYEPSLQQHFKVLLSVKGKLQMSLCMRKSTIWVSDQV